MENYLKISQLEENEKLLVGRIFTRLQYNILVKRLSNQELDSNEKTYYYKFIKPKIKAILSFSNICPIQSNGRSHILPGRFQKASEIIRILSRKHKKARILITGSFLFNWTYKDIDVFIISRYNKDDYFKDDLHITYLLESELDTLFFASLSKICVRNFSVEPKDVFEINIEEIIQDYELLVNFLINRKNCDFEIRKFILHSQHISKKMILDTKQLFGLRKNIMSVDTLKKIQAMMIETLFLSSPKDKLLKKLRELIDDYSKLLRQYKKAKNIRHYIETYEKVIQLASR